MLPRCLGQILNLPCGTLLQRSVMVCVQSWSATYLSCQEYFELRLNYPSVILHQSGQTPLTFGINTAFWKREFQIAGYFFLLLFSVKTQRPPDPQLVKSSVQPVWCNNHATLMVTYCKSPFFQSLVPSAFSNHVIE